MTKSPTTMFWISSVDPIDSSEKEPPFERSYTNVDKRPGESRTREARRQIQGVEEKGYEEERREYRTETQNGGKWEDRETNPEGYWWRIWFDGGAFKRVDGIGVRKTAAVEPKKEMERLLYPWG